ncbi:MAG: hypothetical protein MJ231_01710 [bacterium]|nr:hypothetical protein [bacterium]
MSVNAINPILFRGSGSESTGSPAFLTNALNLPEQEPDTIEISSKKNPNFKAHEDDKKGMSGLGVIGLTTLGAAALIVGLGFAGKAMHNNKITNETIKNFLDKKYPKLVTDKCYEWCGWTKEQGVKGKVWVTDTALPAIRDFFKGDKK